MPNPLNPKIKTEIIPVLFILAAFFASFYFYALFPERVATHWNAAGEPDGYSSKAFGAFLFPLFGAFMYLFMLLIPKFDPKRENYKKFRHIYHLIKGAVVVFFVLIYFAVSLNAIGLNVPVAMLVPAGVGMLFFVIGFYLKDVQPNWFFGIRTPWTLSSDIVWQKTHKFGSKIFMMSGLFFFLAAFFPEYSGWFIGLAIALILSTILYSYIIYKR